MSDYREVDTRVTDGSRLTIRLEYSVSSDRSRVVVRDVVHGDFTLDAGSDRALALDCFKHPMVERHRARARVTSDV